MSAELTVRSAAITQWDEDFRRLVKQSVLKPQNREATGAELSLFAEQAVRTGLDPMSRQIYGIFRKDNRNGGQEVMTIQVGIDGLRAVAERTGRYAGGPAVEFCGPDKVWTDIWTETQKPVAARATVLKVIGSTVIKTVAIALWTEYGNTQNVWRDKPSHMLGKCAEALALRKAFPLDLSGLYTDDEMDRADEPAIVEQTPATDGKAANVVGEDVALELSGFAEGLTSGAVKLVLAACGVLNSEAVYSSDFRELAADKAADVATALMDLQQKNEQVPA